MRFYWADLEGGRHPVVVVWREELNRGDRVVAVPITSPRFAVRSALPHCVPLPAGNFGMTTDCVIQCDAVFPAFKSDLELDPHAMLDETTLHEVVKAVGYVMDADASRPDLQPGSFGSRSQSW